MGRPPSQVPPLAGGCAAKTDTMTVNAAHPLARPAKALRNARGSPRPTHAPDHNANVRAPRALLALNALAARSGELARRAAARSGRSSGERPLRGSRRPPRLAQARVLRVPGAPELQRAEDRPRG